MKKVLVLLFLAAFTAHGQVRFALMGGMAVPTGNFQNFAESSPSIGFDCFVHDESQFGLILSMRHSSNPFATSLVRNLQQRWNATAFLFGVSIPFHQIDLILQGGSMRVKVPYREAGYDVALSVGAAYMFADVVRVRAAYLFGEQPLHIPEVSQFDVSLGWTVF
jgi:hypothetical protein